jgi:putative toxin-antitoxin system antitoxin component (TIGR02293 family)
MASLSTKPQPKSPTRKVAKPFASRGTSFSRAKAKALKPEEAVSVGHESVYEGNRTADGDVILTYSPRKGGVDAYVRSVRQAAPMEIVRLERQGVQGRFIKDLSKSMGLASSRVFSILGVPKATAEKKAAAGEFVTGRGGQSAVGMIKLLGIAQDMVENSTATEAKNFDTAKWLGQWIETPHPALGGHKPADFIDTPTGVAIVARVLGAIQSGAYQ